MNNSQIAKLLDKYFAGETTLREEQDLKDYFSYGEVAPDFQEYAPLFQFFTQAGEQELSESFDAKLMEMLKQENNVPATINPVKKEAKVFRLNLKTISRIAAAIVFVLAAWYFYEKPQPVTPAIASNENQEQIDWSKYEVKSKEEAYQKTLMALKKTSYEMNVGAGMVAKEMSKTRVEWKKILK